MKGKKRIAVCMELIWPYNRDIMINSGIAKYSTEHTDWQLEQCEYPEVFMARGTKYDGIIGRISKACYEKAAELNIPTVNVWMNSPVRKSIPTVAQDYSETGRIAAEHLIARGFKRIVHIGYKKCYSTKLHLRGVQMVAREHGLPCSSYRVSLKMDENSTEWTKFVSDIQKFQSGWKAPVGIAVVNDEISRSLASMLIYFGWKIPEEAAIVGAGKNDLICNSTNPTLSTIALACHERGYFAAGLLDKILRGEKVSNKEHFLPSKELVVGESSDIYAVDDPYLEKALKYISNNSDRELSVAHIAKTVGMSRRTLEYKFKKKLNRTINGEIIRLRIERLKRLLLETDEPVKSLCSEVGFGANSHMHNIFKRYTGMTPTQFRKKHITGRAKN